MAFGFISYIRPQNDWCIIWGIMLKAKGLSNHKWILATNVYASATNKFLWLKNSWDLISFMIIFVCDLWLFSDQNCS